MFNAKDILTYPKLRNENLTTINYMSYRFVTCIFTFEIYNAISVYNTYDIATTDDYL